MKPFLLCALVIFGSSAQAATILLTGEAVRADPLGGLAPFDISIDTSFEVDDAQVTRGLINSGPEGLPVSVTGTVTINDTTFGDGDIGLQVFSNAVFGIRVDVAGTKDGTTNVSRFTNDFRLFGSSFDGLALLDAVNNSQTIAFSDIAFFEDGQGGPSQGSVLGSYSLLITDYMPPQVAAVPLPANFGFGALGILALAGLRSRHQTAKAVK